MSREVEPIFLSVVIPAFNEEVRLPPTLESIVTHLREQDYRWELLVVDDGSKDRTAERVRAQMKEIPELQLLSYGENRGKGFAVRYGMLRATGKYRLFMDADNSTTIDHFDAFRPYLEQGYNVVLGSRDVDGADIAVRQVWWKERLGDLGNLWIRLWAVPGIHDTQAGFKVFSDRAVEDVFPFLTIDRWGFDVEALAVARLRGYKLVERPIRWVNDSASKVSARAYLDVLREVVQVRMGLLKGTYRKG